MPTQAARIAALAERLEDGLVQTRRDFHMNPELAGQESRTAGIVAGRLRALGLSVREGVGGHGVIGTLQGSREGPVVAWRADMDAVTLDDALDAPYRSRVPGAKHACGHDAHTAIGLGVAEVLVAIREDLAGAVKFVFQPAEETAEGAKAMLADGCLEGPRPSAIFGLHVSPAPAGRVSVTDGTCLAAISRFWITLRPCEDGVDENLDALAADLSDALAARNRFEPPKSAEALDVLMQAMLTGAPLLQDFVHFGHLRQEAASEAGTRLLRGSVFTAGDSLRQAGAEILRGIVAGFIDRHSVEAEVVLREFVPATVNDPDLASFCLEAAKEVVGEDGVQRLQAPWPFGGEDFAYYLQQVPGVYFHLGAANRDREILGLPHEPDYDLDESVLVVGTKVVANVLAAYLEQNPRREEFD
jgi:metal-dependent amidase/aminoacylase/carboxypeptidase family protein